MVGANDGPSRRQQAQPPTLFLAERELKSHDIESNALSESCVTEWGKMWGSGPTHRK